jgi:predicted AlkP superfamily pyrophosphatase or phosphodiesterase
VKKTLGLLCGVVILSVFAAMAGEPAGPQPEPKPADRQVILLTLDGFPAWMWRDESLPAPHLRRLAREGAAARAMTVSNPSITWINHTTLVTGVTPRRHGVLYNGLLVRPGPDQPPKIEPWVDKARLVFAPTLYDLAFQAGLTTAEVNWVAITRAPTIHWSFPEIPRADGKVEQEMIAAGVLRPEQVGWFHGPARKNMPWHDATWTEAASFIFQKHRPNLLLCHQLNPDAIHHQYGPGSPASYTALAYADALVGELLETVQRSGAGPRTTIFVASDHGFKKVAKIIYPNVTLRRAGYLKASGAAIGRYDAVAMAEGGMAFVYLADRQRKTELLPALKKLLAASEGVAKVYDGEEGPAFGMPTPEENQGMGDLFLFAKDGYAFKGEAQGAAAVAPTQGYLGTHGYRADDPDMDGIFIACGNGIKRGVSLRRVANLDVAPTIARLLGLEIPRPEGRVLTEILAEK